MGYDDVKCLLSSDNIIQITGKIIGDLEYSHEAYGEKFYNVILETERLSGNVDRLPMIVSERLLESDKYYINQFVFVSGQIRTRNMNDESGTHLQVFIFVKDFGLVNNDHEYIDNVVLHGYICKEPIYRTTPSGREISDVLLAVNRTYNKSDYIPCICWGRNAKYVSTLPIGTKISVDGRMQSRIYTKQMENGDVIEKTAYEISINSIELI